MADNAGATDEHRALNYCVVRYPAIYANAAQAFARDSSLTAVDVRISPLSGTRNIVDIIFSYTNRNTDVTEKFFVRVDVTEEFPFLVTKLFAFPRPDFLLKAECPSQTIAIACCSCSMSSHLWENWIFFKNRSPFCRGME